MHYKMLSLSQRDALIAHIDGPVDVNRHQNTALFLSQNALLHRGLLRDVEHSSNNKRPTATELTMEGRKILSVMLGDYADALVRAGLEEIAQVKDLTGILRKRLAARNPVDSPASTPATPEMLAQAMSMRRG